MTLRLRFTIAAAVAAALAVLGVAVVGVTVTRWRLRTEVDNSLQSDAEGIAKSPIVTNFGNLTSPDRDRGGPPRSRPGEASLQGGVGAFQVINSAGTVVFGRQYVEAFDVDEVDRAVAAGTSQSVLRDRTVDEKHLRIATVAAPNNLAVQMARPIDDIDRTVSSLVAAFLFIGLAGIVVGGGIGFVVAGKALKPVKRLGDAAEEVARRQDPTLPVPETGGAELVSLGRSINMMLASLDDARQHERRLIDDAAHELRTPLTSLRTNIEVLTSGRLPVGADHDALLDDLNNQMEEFTTLVADLDALARRDAGDRAVEHIDIGDVVTTAVRRAQRRSGSVVIETTLDAPGQIMGDSALIERAIVNVIDNAVKWSPEGGTVRVGVQHQRIEVTDQGPGIAPEDIPFVFDRFWRAPTARAMPGSGLGLAIVRQAIDAHGGAVTIDANPGGGTRVVIDLARAAFSG